MSIDEQHFFDECPEDIFDLSLQDVQSILHRFGTNNLFGEGDFGIRDVNQGNWEHSVGLDNWDLLSTNMVDEIAKLIVKKWRRFSVDITLIEDGRVGLPRSIQITSHGVHDHLDRISSTSIPGELPFDQLIIPKEV